MIYRLALLPTNGAPDNLTNMVVPHCYGPAQTPQNSTRSNFLPVFPDLRAVLRAVWPADNIAVQRQPLWINGSRPGSYGNSAAPPLIRSPIAHKIVVDHLLFGLAVRSSSTTGLHRVDVDDGCVELAAPDLNLPRKSSIFV
jgi:hypothetical protein